ncbi:MAG: purine-nucleoside phosphorylase [bacterium]|nr:purine-nucleoside phosphorylase [bacterium]
MSGTPDRLAILTEGWRRRVGAAVDHLRADGFAGRVGLILGSGLGNFVDAIEDAHAVEYGDIPGYATTTVAEHSGRLVRGTAGGVPVVVMQGRLHPYEGLPLDELLLPTAVLGGLGIEAAVITNAAGGLNRLYTPGDLMVIRDQIDMHLDDPLRGLLAEPFAAPPGAPGAEGAAAVLAEIGRSGGLPDLYDVKLAGSLVAAGGRAGVPVHTGTYASMPGPAYEAKAEIGMLRRIGCDAVGMSTAPETVLLRRLGVRTVGLSCITNPARETGQPQLSHQDVVEVGAMVRDRVAKLLLAFLESFSGGS